MGLSKPYFLTYRPNVRQGESDNLYMHDDRYLPNRWQTRQSIELLYKDFETLFDYVEPCDSNKGCYSLRIYELLLCTCTEIESNMKMILVKNGYKGNDDRHLNMSDYAKLNNSHYLSKFEVAMPNWTGTWKVSPFEAWNESQNNRLPWYTAYNHVKHNRQEMLFEATLRNVVEALCGLLVLYSAQFYNGRFADVVLPNVYGWIGLDDGLSDAIGAPFRIKFPEYPDDEEYDFCWRELSIQDNPYMMLFCEG